MTKFFTALLFLCSASTYCEVKVNGRSLSTIVKPGETISSTYEKGSNVSCSLDGQNMTIGTLELDNEASITKRWKYLIDNQSQMSRLSVGSVLNLRSGISSNHQGAYLSAKEKAMLEAGQDITINDSIIESPHIFLRANRLDVRCFVKNGKFLQIEIPSESSPIEAIRFTFADEYSLPFFVQVDANAEEKTPSRFVALGVKAIQVQFREIAFKE